MPLRRALLGAICALGVLCGWGLVPSGVLAAEPVVLPQGPVPVDELKPVEFSFLTIDTTITAADGGLAIETRTRTRLRNPEKKTPFDRQVTFPGLPVTAVKVGTLTGGLRLAEGQGPWQLQLPPDGDAMIEGVQQLSTAGPLAEIQFDWAVLRCWGAPLGAVRLSLHFPDRLHSEQLLAVDPVPTERDTLRLTWSYEKFQPKGRVRVLFVAPQYWRAVHQARQAASGDQAGAAEYLALAAALRPLADASDMPPEYATALHAEVLAALRRAVAAAPQDPHTHDELAAYLRARAGGQPALLAEAVAQLKTAYDLAPQDDGVKQHLLAAVDELMAACRQAGDRRGLLAALDIVEAVAPQASQERAAAYADLIVGLLESGRINEAEATAVAGFGPQALSPYLPYRPHFAAVWGEVQTHIGRRLMRFTLVPAAGMEQAAGRDLDALVAALSRIQNARVTRTPQDAHTVVEVTIPFANPKALSAAGQAIVGALPADADPALLLVTATASPPAVTFGARRELQRDRLVYGENADLSAAQEALARLQQQMQAARQEAELPTDDPLEAARRRWVVALLKRYDADWRVLTQGCSVAYRVLPPEDIIAPQWTLAWGERRSLAWSTTIPHLERLKSVAIGLAIVVPVGLVGYALWRRRRPRIVSDDLEEPSPLASAGPHEHTGHGEPLGPA